MIKKIYTLVVSLALCILFALSASDLCFALKPDEVLVLANSTVPESVFLAEYYMEKRKIPEKNLVILKITDKETCRRSEYEEKAAAPVKKYIKNYKPERHIRCIALMYGIPLRVAAPIEKKLEDDEINRLEEKKKEFNKDLENILKGQSKTTVLKDKLKKIKGRINQLRIKRDRVASFDSEIALVLKKDYSLSAWVLNPYYIGFSKRTLKIEKKDILMVSRIDGPIPNIARRIIDECLEVEKNGLAGTAYFDARWPNPGNKKLTGYTLYDRSIHNAANYIKKKGLMEVKIDYADKLFQAGECPKAALYCGWYSLAKYIDAFKWQPGSVGYHIASSECVTLKKKGSRIWCKMMLEKGIGATIGPVGEPYVEAFPLPEIFFRFLTDGYFTLAECYLVSHPYLSWKMILIGDPLYRPFNSKVINQG